jgi:hypothetical protein
MKRGSKKEDATDFFANILNHLQFFTGFLAPPLGKEDASKCLPQKDQKK